MKHRISLNQQNDYKINMNNELYAQVASLKHLGSSKMSKRPTTYPKVKTKQHEVPVHRPKTVSFKIDEFYDIDITMFQRHERWSLRSDHDKETGSSESALETIPKQTINPLYSDTDGIHSKYDHNFVPNNSIPKSSDFTGNRYIHTSAHDLHKNGETVTSHYHNEILKPIPSQGITTSNEGNGNIMLLHQRQNENERSNTQDKGAALGMRIPRLSSKSSIYDIPWEHTNVGHVISQVNSQIGVDNIVLEKF